MTDQLADTENTMYSSKLSVDESVVGDTRKVVQMHNMLVNLFSQYSIVS